VAPFAAGKTQQNFISDEIKSSKRLIKPHSKETAGDTSSSSKIELAGAP
jgi:hypothetical protein